LRVFSSGVPFALLAWWSLLLSLATGLFLAYHYRPWGDVFREVSRLTGLIPHGGYIRNLHYLSGQCFLIFTLGHTLDCFLKGLYRKADPWEWAKLILLPALGFLLLLTGFILKGDKEGVFAASVMFHLVQEIPLLGTGLSRLVLRPGEDFFLLPYLHHVIIIPLTVLFLLGQHRKRLLPGGNLGWPLLAFLSLLALFYPLPKDIPLHVELVNPSGPWFFQGIQLLLRYIPPFWAGIVWPLLPLALMASLPIVPARHISWVTKLTWASWIAHGGILVFAWWYIPGKA
jgi:ubiquinol-cytochrome c reductase cytochrome b subunit